MRPGVKAWAGGDSQQTKEVKAPGPGALLNAGGQQ